MCALTVLVGIYFYLSFLSTNIINVRLSYFNKKLHFPENLKLHHIVVCHPPLINKEEEKEEEENLKRKRVRALNVSD